MKKITDDNKLTVKLQTVKNKRNCIYSANQIGAYKLWKALAIFVYYYHQMERECSAVVLRLTRTVQKSKGSYSRLHLITTPIAVYLTT